MLVIFDEMENFIERYQLPNSRGNRNLSRPITSKETISFTQRKPKCLTDGFYQRCKIELISILPKNKRVNIFQLIL